MFAEDRLPELGGKPTPGGGRGPGLGRQVALGRKFVRGDTQPTLFSWPKDAESEYLLVLATKTANSETAPYWRLIFSWSVTPRFWSGISIVDFAISDFNLTLASVC
jgi:hypothetical protein